ncbi:nucleoside-triphosphatase [Hydrogenivirga caldilitoris]|uniref:Nucleoside-triphosphatase BCF55_1618 n=1 Tax=Hydrogenivirga caldilitoris TaxID=246264 RepID=A0A497XTA7_9AQUI|nr:NTPase [Hydrogenivirga caldilitoris]RLJ71319.1 nucleoside-triphosphatase [Hydrogenivirga caldilitoris]
MKIFITGEPGVGKTTLIKKIVQRLGDKALGFWTQEVRDRKTRRRIGFKVVTTEGKEALFASKNFTSKHLVGSYGVNVKRFEEVVLPILKRALKERDKVIVIDEVGKMELFSKEFRELVSSIARDPKSKILATLPIRDVHPLVRELRKLQGAVLIELTRSNREGMEEEVMKLLT